MPGAPAELPSLLLQLWLFIPYDYCGVAMETPWVRFACLLAFVPCFLIFVFRFCSFFYYYFSCIPVCFIFVSLRLCSSNLLLSESTYFIVRVLSACVICTLTHLGILLFFNSFSSSYFSGGVFCFVLLLYPVRQHLICSSWFFTDVWFFSCLTVCDHIICISLGWRTRKDTGGTADVG